MGDYDTADFENVSRIFYCPTWEWEIPQSSGAHVWVLGTGAHPGAEQVVNEERLIFDQWGVFGRLRQKGGKFLNISSEINNLYSTE